MEVVTECDMLQDALIMAGTAAGVVLNAILLMQTLKTARDKAQREGALLTPQPI